MLQEKNSYIDLKEVSHGSEAYKATIDLRYKILREPLGLIYTQEQLDAEHADHHLAAYVENELVACLVLSPVDTHTIKMRQVAVSAACQGKGYGKELVKYSELWAKEHGYTVMALHARETAVPFYERLEYKNEGQPFIEVGLTHYKMWKVISS